MSRQRMYDTDSMEYATNYDDGSLATGEYVRELGCCCGLGGCGGCMDIILHHTDRDYYTMADRRKVRRLERRAYKVTA